MMTEDDDDDLIMHVDDNGDNEDLSSTNIIMSKICTFRLQAILSGN